MDRDVQRGGLILFLAGAWGAAAALDALEVRAPSDPVLGELDAARAVADPRLVPRRLRAVPGVGARRAFDLARTFRFAGTTSDPTRIHGVGPRTAEALTVALGDASIAANATGSQASR